MTGPVFVEGAEPGDALKATLVAFTPSGWGWTALIPGFGLLADQFPEPALTLWSYDPNGLAPAAYAAGGRVPLKPFCGTIGLAPAAPGNHSVVPPRRVGGNMDVRDIGEGTVLTLPVEVPGALFSIGDTHAAQGDGEVGGTAIESPMAVTLSFDLVKGAGPRFPRFETPGPVSRHFDAKGYHVTTGIGPDLMAGGRAAVSDMIELLGTLHGLAAADAYMLCSTCADLRISEIVDVPNWVVSFYFMRRGSGTKDRLRLRRGSGTEHDQGGDDHSHDGNPERDLDPGRDEFASPARECGRERRGHAAGGIRPAVEPGARRLRPHRLKKRPLGAGSKRHACAPFWSVRVSRTAYVGARAPGVQRKLRLTA